MNNKVDKFNKDVDKEDMSGNAVQASSKKNSKPTNRGRSNRNRHSHSKSSNRNGSGKTMIPRVHNDISWYAKNPTLLRNAASLSFNAAVGTQIVTSMPSTTPNVRYIPGIITIRVLPGVGHSVDNSSGVNIGARALYAYNRSKNSGATNYNAPDLMMYFLAMDQMYTFFNWIQRAYGAMQYFNQYNRYTPDAVISAMGIDPESMRANLAGMRYYVNLWAAQINSLNVPANMPLYKRHAFMFSSVYADSNNVKPQYYVFNPYTFLKYDEMGSEKGGRLVPIESFPVRIVPVAGNDQLITYEQIINAGNEMIQALLLSEDIGTMSGDVLKAWGDQGLFKVSAMPEDYLVTPTFDESILNQIHNSYAVGTPVSGTYRIEQDPDTNAIIYNPTFRTEVSLPGSRMLNMPWSDPTPENVMYATRLMAGQTENGTADLVTGTPTSTYQLDSFGTEIVTDYYLIKYNDSVVKPTLTAYQYTSAVIGKGQFLQSYGVDPERLADVVAFDWHPLLYLANFLQSGSPATYKSQFVKFFGDISMYTIIEPQTLKRIHETAVFSEFDVPVDGRI